MWHPSAPTVSSFMNADLVPLAVLRAQQAEEAVLRKPFPVLLGLHAGHTLSDEASSQSLVCFAGAITDKCRRRDPGWSSRGDQLSRFFFRAAL